MKIKKTMWINRLKYWLNVCSFDSEYVRIEQVSISFCEFVNSKNLPVLQKGSNVKIVVLKKRNR